MKAAYADPPYLNCGQRLYGKLHKQASEYDDPMAHKRLIERLCDEYESWGLSTHTPALRILLPWCPEDVRVCAWVKPFCSAKAIQLYHAWEPILVLRPKIIRKKGIVSVRDFVIATPPVFTGKGLGIPGQKPDAFCEWLFDALALKPSDDFHDLFPGSGVVGAAWDKWRARSDPTQFQLEASPA